VFEVAPTGRARCRGCGQPIAKGERRLGDVFVSPFAEDAETTHWYHPRCCALKRPTVLLAALEQNKDATAAEQELRAVAQFAIAHRRLPRIDGAERAPSARATCRHCKHRIDQGNWRIRLVWFEDGRFEPSGFVHATCARAYFETDRLLAPIRCFSKDLQPADVVELEAAFSAPGAPSG
jgi:hypothetical protein